MTVRNLESLFKPTSVALIGASNRSGSVGAVLAENLIRAGFEGPIYPVNPKYARIQGRRSYPDVVSLPEAPDLAVVSTPPDTVPGLVGELGARGARACVVITAGLGERDEPRGRELQKSLLASAKSHGMRVMGPNCLGLLVPGIGLNASFAHIAPASGHLAFVAQSGAIVTSVLDWAHSRGIGFSHLVSLGDMADVDFGDVIDYLANEPHTRAILLYVEAVTHARKFMSAARAAARMKPVIVVKAGRYAEGARATRARTGTLTGSDSVYDAAFRRAGMLRVLTLAELFDAVETLAMVREVRGDRLAIVSNGRGIGVLATDALIEAGGRLAELSPESLSSLDKVLPSTWSRGNPIDILGDAPASRYGATLDALAGDKGIDAVLVLNCPTAIASGRAAAEVVVEKAVAYPSVRILTSWVGNGKADEAHQLFAEHQIPSYSTPEQAVRAFMYLVDYRRSQELLMQTPPSVPEQFSFDTERARRPIEAALEDGRTWLTEPEAKEVLRAYGVPVVSTRACGTPEQAAGAAAEFGGAVTLKIVSPEISHKSDVGGVVLDLAGPAAVRAAADTMLERVHATHPTATITGFSVSPMVRRPGAYELIVGMCEDAEFGPVMFFGHGGSAVEAVGDRALALPPLNMHLARELMSRTRIYKLLKGYRGLPGANLDAVALTLIRLAQLVVDVPEIAQLDINPLLADDYGVMALDARITVAEARGTGSERLTIRPYPKELEETVPLGDGRTLLLRPILPEDEPSLQAAFAKLTLEEIRLRFFVPMKTMSHVLAARFTQIDYDREMAFILTEAGIPGTTELFGTVRIAADLDHERAEYAILVRGDMTGMGLGIVLMRRIVDYARARGIRELYGDVLRENTTMLRLCQVLGFTRSNLPDEPGVVRVTLKLQS